MDNINWNSSFSVGVTILDEQHKQIINMINLLLSNSKTDVRSEVVSDLLNKMMEYANNHFETEELLLQKYGYPDLSTQKHDHEVYCLKVVDLCENTMKYNISVPEKLLQYLTKWWINHILHTDMKYKAFLLEQGVT